MTGVDYAPSELQEQVPFVVDLEREMPGDDRPDYWLGAVRAPLKWIVDNHERKITHVVIAARWEGTAIEPGVTHLPVGIAFVTDPTLLEDDRLDLSKCSYVAIGVATDTSGMTESDPRSSWPPHPPVVYGEEPDLDADEFLSLARTVWPRDYSVAGAQRALRATVNLTARVAGELVGSVRILTDGYFFGTIPEVVVHPKYQGRGIGRRLMELAWERSPTGLFFGAQEGNEGFFDKLGYGRSMTSFAGRKPRPKGDESSGVEGEGRPTE